MKRFLLPILFLGTCVHASGIQKWVDDNGQVHYGDSPPAKAATETIRISRPPSNPGKSLPRLGSQQDDEDAPQAPDDEQPQSAESEAETPSDQAAEFCQQARNDLRVINTSKRIRLQATDGTSRYMTTEEREERRTQAEQDIERYCQ